MAMNTCPWCSKVSVISSAVTFPAVTKQTKEHHFCQKEVDVVSGDSFIRLTLINALKDVVRITERRKCTTG
jgi:hypothetical protein